MKQKSFTLTKSRENRTSVTDNLLNEIMGLDFAQEYEVVIRNPSVSKTLRQLRGHFGVVLGEVSDQSGHTINKLHRDMKKAYLREIYISEPQNPLQEQWVELLELYLEKGPPEKFEAQANRISLEWISKSQMKNYMDLVISHYRDAGFQVSSPSRENLARH